MESIGKRFWKGARDAATDATSAAGGLGVLWNPNLVSIMNLCVARHLISARFHILGTVMKEVVTNVYGPFQPSQKAIFLEEIYHTKEWVGREHWIIGGDFNLIRSLEEKKGGVWSLSNISASLNKLIEELQLVDVTTTNGLFTWQNKRSGAMNIASLLEQFLVSESTLVGEREIGAMVFPAVGSDHWPICL